MRPRGRNRVGGAAKKNGIGFMPQRTASTAARKPAGNPVPPRLRGYRYVGVIGKGSTAYVFRYRQEATERDVAIKVGTTHLDSKAGARFKTEAVFMASLQHPNILTVHGAGVTDDGRPYTIFEYAPAGSVRDIIAAQGVYTVDRTLDYGVQLASALYLAHRNNTVHRDLKTSNILITAQGVPAIADFGIATNIYDHRSTGYSPPWAPPEVIASRGGGDDRSDIYSLAATLYAMLAGKSPFEYAYDPRTIDELVDCIMHKPVPPINRADVPQSLQQVLLKALSPDPANRYFTAVEFARALQEVQIQLYGHATPVNVQGIEPYPTRAAMATAGAQGASLPAAPAKPKDRRPLIVTAVVVAALAVLGIVFAAVILPNLDHSGDTRTATVVNPGMNGTSGGDDDDDVTTTVPSPIELSGAYEGDTVKFTWSNPDPQDGDRYAWSIINGADSGQANAKLIEGTSVEVPASDGAQTCIQVSIVRQDRRMSSTPATTCAVK